MGFRSFLKRIKDFSVANSASTAIFLELLRSGTLPGRKTKRLLSSYRYLPWLRGVASRIGFAMRDMVWYVEVGGERVDTHPLIDLLERGNPHLDRETIFQITQTWIDLRGEAFWLKERNGRGEVIEIWPISPADITNVPDERQPDFLAGAKRYAAKDIVWIKDPNPQNIYGRGIGVIESLIDELEIDEYIAKHIKAWFFNRAIPPILIGVEGADKESLAAAKEKFEAEHQGMWNAFKSHWHSGRLTVKELSQKFSDMQLLELRKQERDVILQVLGIPPEIMGIIEHSNRATIQAADYIFSKWVILPRLELFRGALQRQLVPEFGTDIKIKYENPVQEDKAFKLKVMARAPQHFTPNDWREMAGLSPIENGDELEVPVELAKSVKVINVEDVHGIVDMLHYGHLIHIVEPEYRKLIAVWGERTLTDLEVDLIFNVHRITITDHLAKKELKIKGINETTKKALLKHLSAGVQAGEGIEKLKKRVVTKVFKPAATRARTIARTEVLSSANFAVHEGYVQSGVVNRREWVATLDGLERDAHGEMDRQKRAIDKPFTAPGGETAMYPGAFGIAELDINCRCTTIAVIEDPKSKDRREHWKNWDRALIPWEKLIERKFKQGFAEQQKIILEALDALGVYE